MEQFNKLTVLTGVVLVLLACIDVSDAQCSPGNFPYNGYCYSVLQYPAEYIAAETYCNVAGGSLAAVSDINTYNFLQSVLQFAMVTRYWIGVRMNQTLYGYNPYGTTGSTADYSDNPQYWDSNTWVYDSNITVVANPTFWAPNQPSFSSVYGDVNYPMDFCSVLSYVDRFQWDDENCNASFGYICQVTGGSASNGCCASDGTCYTVVNEGASFLQARQGCISMGGILAEPRTSTQMLFLMALLTSATQAVSNPASVQPYNGQVLTAGSWVLTSSSSSIFGPNLLPWASGTPLNEVPPCGSCVYLTLQGLALDTNCAFSLEDYGGFYNSDFLYPICVYTQAANTSSCAAS